MKPSVRAIGEAMIEFAPLPDGLYRRGFAGDTFNTAWHMAQVLQDRAEVGMVTRLGTDSISDAFATEMQSDGMVTTGVSRDPVRIMGLYQIALKGVERSFHYWRENAAARLLADDPAALATALAGVGLIHVSGITLAILAPAARENLFAAIGAARAAGATISFDPNIRPRLWSSMQEMRHAVTQMLGLTDIALPSLDDEVAHFDDRSQTDTLQRMAQSGVKRIVIKDGAGPVCSWDDGMVTSIPTPPVEQICDTTGAGDGFNAGFLAACVLGQPMQAAVQAGQAMAACVLQQFGARADKAAIRAIPAFRASLA